MPNPTPQINLDIRNWAESAPGWTQVSASNGQTYSYCYSGGDDGLGGLVQNVGQGRDVAPLRITADRRYQLDDANPCVFTDDVHNQLSWTGNGRYAGSIIDVNSMVENAKYTVNVTDTSNGNCTIACDPRVVNQ